jgi:hypothetical protein
MMQRLELAPCHGWWGLQGNGQCFSRLLGLHHSAAGNRCRQGVHRKKPRHGLSPSSTHHHCRCYRVCQSCVPQQVLFFFFFFFFSATPSPRCRCRCQCQCYPSSSIVAFQPFIVTLQVRNYGIETRQTSELDVPNALAVRCTRAMSRRPAIPEAKAGPPPLALFSTSHPSPRRSRHSCTFLFVLIAVSTCSPTGTLGSSDYGLPTSPSAIPCT